MAWDIRPGRIQGPGSEGGPWEGSDSGFWRGGFLGGL